MRGRKSAAGMIRLSMQVALAALVVVALVALGLAQLLIHHERETLLAIQDTVLVEDARQGKETLLTEFRESSADVALLSRLPPVAGIMRATRNGGIDPQDGNSLVQWRTRLEEIFTAFIQSHPQYLQLRFIGVSDNGRELVRVNQRDGRAEVVAPDALQAKGDMPYFTTTTRLKPNEIYISDINLNREHGQIVLPPQPTIRFAMPVFTPDGQIFGIIIINVDFHYFERSIDAVASPGVQGHLANMAGDYLYHPDDGRVFGYEFGRPYRCQDEFPGLEVQAAPSAGYTPHVQQVTSVGGQFRAVATQVNFDPLQPSRYLTVIHALPESLIESSVATLRPLLFVGIATSALLIMLLLLWLINRAFKPLAQLTQVASDITGGQYDTSIPDIGTGELGKLSEAIAAMQHAVAEREVELRQERDRTRLYLEVAEVFIVVLDAAARVQLVNRKACETLGWALDDIVGKPWQDFCAKEVRDAWAAYFRRLMAGETAPQDWSEYAIVTRSGEARLLEWRRFVLRDDQGNPYGTVSSGRDVTEERKAQHDLAQHQANLEATIAVRTADLRVSEAHARAILTTMLDSVVHIDAAGVILSVNDATQAMFGFTADEMLGRNVSMLMPEPHASAHDGYLARFRQTREPHTVGSRTVRKARHKEGRPFTVEVAVNEMVDDAGSTFIGVLRDMTAQEAAERQLTEAVQAAQAAAEAKSNFLANMSHEIRTPLNAVLGLARIGQRDSQDSKAGQTFTNILDSGQHLLGVINDILDFSKIEAGKLQVEQRPFALRATIDSVIRFVRERAAAKRLPLTVSLAPELTDWVIGDSLRLTQILTNLLSNAIKFTERGEVLLRVAREDGTIAFLVVDSGIGMSAEQQARLFQPFEQADSSTTRNYGGTGLGLAISWNLAHLMDGTLSVDSQLGEGCSFTLLLPLPATTAPVHPDPSGTHHVATGPRLNGLEILAADDVEMNRFILEDLLMQEGAHAVFASNGQEALDRLEEAGIDHFDVVLMDVQMPVMDGYVATRRIAALAPGLPVIGLTAHALAEERDKCLVAGMVDHVTKPIDPATLVAAILRHVQSMMPATTAPAAAVPPAPTFTASLVDYPALLARFNGRHAFVAKLIASMYEQHAASPTKLREAAAAHDCTAIAFVAHGLKGVSGNLKATVVFDLAKATEMAAREARPDAAALANQLATLVEAMLAELAETEKPAAQSPTTGDADDA